jgi:hypothetical protein
MHDRQVNPRANHLDNQQRLNQEAQLRVQRNAGEIRREEELRVIEALVREQVRMADINAVRIATRIRQEFGGMPGEMPVHRDSQNVHRLDVRSSQEVILNVLARKTPLPLKETLRMYANQKTSTPPRTILQRIFPFLKRQTLARQTSFDYILAVANLNPEYYMTVNTPDRIRRVIDLSEGLNLVLHGVMTAPVEYRTALRQRLDEEVRESTGKCVAGCYARILNTFAGFEEVVLGIPPVDPRSLNERLGDLFGALAKREMNTDAKRAEGIRILTENGVHGEAQATWLDAL